MSSLPTNLRDFWRLAKKSFFRLNRPPHFLLMVVHMAYGNEQLKGSPGQAKKRMGVGGCAVTKKIENFFSNVPKMPEVGSG